MTKIKNTELLIGIILVVVLIFVFARMFEKNLFYSSLAETDYGRIINRGEVAVYAENLMTPAVVIEEEIPPELELLNYEVVTDAVYYAGKIEGDKISFILINYGEDGLPADFDYVNINYKVYPSEIFQAEGSLTDVKNNMDYSIDTKPMGDINLDGVINYVDRDILLSCKESKSQNSFSDCFNADIDKSGIVDSSDGYTVNLHINEYGCSIINNWCNLTDVNRDSFVNDMDVSIVNQYLNKGCKGLYINCTNADTDGSGQVLALDYQAVRNNLLAQKNCSAVNRWCNKGDVDRSGRVTALDYFPIKNNLFKKCPEMIKECKRADLDGDYDVDMQDFDLLATYTNYDNECVINEGMCVREGENCPSGWNHAFAKTGVDPCQPGNLCCVPCVKPAFCDSPMYTCDEQGGNYTYPNKENDPCWLVGGGGRCCLT